MRSQASAPSDAGRAADLALARRVAAGDQAAFAELMRGHNRLMYRTARGVLRDEAEAEDAVQEAYLSAFRSIGRYRGEARLSTWLVRLVLNEALGHVRRAGRIRALTARLHDDADMAAAEVPELGAERAEARSRLQVQIDALPEPLRLVFILRALEEMSVEEVAAALEIPRALVAVRFFRARRKLRAALAANGAPGLLPFAGGRCDAMIASTLSRLRTLAAAA
jgi:RNA polymerase sigma-70 factor (ECF subfamily)